MLTQFQVTWTLETHRNHSTLEGENGIFQAAIVSQTPTSIGDVSFTGNQ